MADERAKVRVVRCPKCDKLLPELANFTVYRCGGCNATLQAKRRSAESDASSEKSDGVAVKCLESADVCSEKNAVVASDASSEVNWKGERVEIRGEEEKFYLKDSPISDCTFVPTSENGDDLREPEISKLGESSIESGIKCGDGKYRQCSAAAPNVFPANLDDLVQEKVEEQQETKMQVECTKPNPKFQQKESWRNEDNNRASTFRGPNPYPDEGPSNYNQNSAKRKTFDSPCSAENLDEDRAELLRKLDELRDQLRRSCEVAEKPKERPSASRTTFSNPYARNGRNNWFPEGSSSLNRKSMDLPNLYPTVHPQNGIPGYREVFGPHSLGRAQFHPTGQYARAMSNGLYGQFDPDPLVSYHHDGFYHQPACSCLHCYNSQWPSFYSNQRVPYPVNNHGFYQAEGPSILGQQNYNQRDLNGPLASNEPRYRQRPVFMKKEGLNCRPVAGAAPFVSCYNCFELLQLPEDILRMGKNQHKLRCGSCSQLISFEYDGKRLVTSGPSQKTNTSENNNNGGINNHANEHLANSLSGSFDSTGFEVHSADEKIVLPSYPVSSAEMLEKGYGFHMSESEKMQGLSSSPTTSEDLDSPDSMICRRDVPSSTEIPLEARGLSRVPSLPLREHFAYPLSNQVVDGPGNGSRSRRSDQEKIISTNGNFKQNSVRDVPVASEMDLSADEYPDAGSRDSCEVSNDEDQPRAKNSKNGESFFAGLMKKSFKDFPRFNQSMENGRSKVSINGHPISDRLVKKAEKLAGPIHPGNYWYDYHAGFWGVMGHSCLGIIPPFIEEFNYPMPKSCAGGNTGVFVNGRELHQNDLALLVGRGLPATEGQSYTIDISGKVWDAATGEELDSLGKLAPTIEKVKHGFGMRVPRVSA
ncbi:LOW QUALITY PROTEIN: protein ENHANCED DISEASE RESISTANCE 4-like [Asparagus officinalis]|uniref:LOW QUALITY PROTEIN: protein ENHANCED DISEASE RESISTANCE 4-like n=1 Tax=Asparagus officinalis TaxID=4686 RepID=UPI00098E4460|nr:LOW QUALITY PROTEIN: protein ENHANCED DISEASE RESISTANCE 4-like [Asparagus officinalis]